MAKICALIVLLTLPFSASAMGDPLLYGKNLVYKGAFRAPKATSGVLTTDRGGSTLAFYPAGNSGKGSLFIGGKSDTSAVAEISIKTPKMSNYSTADVIQAPNDPTEGNKNNLGAGGATLVGTAGQLGGLLVHNNKLVGSAYSFYDASGGGVGTQLSHYTHSLDLAATGTFNGMYHVGAYPSNGNASFVSGFMSLVPDNSAEGGTDWVSALGGPALTGNGALSVISRTSLGPAAFSFDPAALTGPTGTAVSATPLLYYPSTHPTLGVNAAPNPVWNGTTKYSGMVMVPGTKSVLFFGYHGLGYYLYGQPTSDVRYMDQCDPAVEPDGCFTQPRPGIATASLSICNNANTCVSGRAGLTDCPGAGTDGCFYDPTGLGAKGPHAFPYINQVWAYDADDLLHVKNQDVIGAERSANIAASCATGTPYQPWCVLPYAVWPMPYDFVVPSGFGSGAAYNPSTKTLYVAQAGAYTPDQYTKLPLIHVFQYDPDAVASNYRVGGQVTLLNGIVKLKNNNADEISIGSTSRTAVSRFRFPGALEHGSAYNVTVSSQPYNQTCSVLNGSGVADDYTDIGNIVISCAGPGQTPDVVKPVTTATPGANTYAGSVTVTLSANETATIRYTIDGSTPTSSSPLYTGPISLAQTTTLKFRATDTAGNIEDVESVLYTVNPILTPPAAHGSLAGIFTGSLVAGPVMAADKLDINFTLDLSKLN